jgi:DNA-binding MarR family transcriptional regulator/GNAT superfamily N-acetyltransferase
VVLARADVAQVRAFNRAVAERIGALTDVFLGRGRPMAESRILWEIGQSPTIELRQLRARLGLDSGYTSRVLQSLAAQGLISLSTSPTDGRVRSIQLTSVGEAELSELDQRSDQVAQSFLEPLSASQRVRLLEAMATVERLLRASCVSIDVEDPTSADARWCIGEYFAELNRRFEAGFDPAQSISADAHELVPPAGLLLVARLRAEPVGCGALKFHADAPAELKRMWVASEARGLGLGRRLLQELEDQARGAGATTIHLETNRSLAEAIALYRASGYREVPAFNDEPYAHHWFEKRVS